MDECYINYIMIIARDQYHYQLIKQTMKSGKGKKNSQNDTTKGEKTPDLPTFDSRSASTRDRSSPVSHLILTTAHHSRALLLLRGSSTPTRHSNVRAAPPGHFFQNLFLITFSRQLAACGILGDIHLFSDGPPPSCGTRLALSPARHNLDDCSAREAL